MTGNGYIKLHRQISENEFYFSERFTKAQAWIDLLLLANHKPNTLFIRGIEIKLHPGELCYSQPSLAKRWKWNFKTVVTFLNLLSDRKMLETKTNNVTTIISIKNWNLYQGNGVQNGEQKETRTETNKNDKNVKNIYGQWFESFWNNYPKKVAKKKAESIFLKICKDENTFQEIINSLNNQKQSENWTKNNGQYIPHPSTWLNGERWKDETGINNTDKVLEL